jgi:hypothetical protein
MTNQTITDQIAIHTSGLTKHYGDVHALVDLVEAGPEHELVPVAAWDWR